MKVKSERLAEEFTRLCEIESPSRYEGRISLYLKTLFHQLGAQVNEDESAAQTGSESGNLLVSFPGRLALPPIFFTCHMDTVPPTTGLKVRREGDLFTSGGNTVLGGDDKSGIAACIEAMRGLLESDTPHRPVEFLFTTCEETGLLGAKAFDPARLQAREGYALDGEGFGEIITHAPALHRIHARIFGQAAHAGLRPEEGVNAIMLAAQALSRMPCGRIDAESTVNFGLIQGGTAVNIVPEYVEITGEARSHNLQTLARLTQEIRTRFAEAASSWQAPGRMAKGRPRVEVEIEEEFPLMALPDGSALIRRLDQVSALCALPCTHQKTGGGSDANILNGRGLATVIVGTGMTNVHSTGERMNLKDMVKLTRLIMALLAQAQF